MKRILLAALLLIGGAASASASPITYDVNRTIGSGSVVGTIETDGTLGVLSASNILSWSLTLSSPNLRFGPTDTITSSAGTAIVGGSGLSATTTALTFNFLASYAGFALQGGDANAWCMVSTGISCIGGPSPSEGIYYSVSGGTAEVRYPTSAEVIATTAVPEPLTLSLFAGGLAGMGALRRRKTKTGKAKAETV